VAKLLLHFSVPSVAKSKLENLFRDMGFQPMLGARDMEKLSLT